MEQNFEQNIPLAPIIAGFIVLLFLTYILQKKLRQRMLIREGQLPTDGNRVPSIEERVANNRTWASGKIGCQGRSPMIILWILALTWNLTFGVSFFKSFSNPAMTTGARVVLGFFAIMGIVPIAFAMRFTIRRLRFGSSCCYITGKAGILGKEMSGNIRTKNEIEATKDYTISLQCIETYYTGSGKNRKSHTNVQWQAKQTLSHNGQSSRAGIPFSFTLPTYPPETGYQLSRGTINWQLRIDAPVKGVDYSALFIVPVFQMASN